MSGWRREDEELLERLEDEGLSAQLFGLIVGGRAPEARIHPRSGGLVGEVRKVSGGPEAVKKALAGDVASLGRFLDALPMRSCPPELLHHLAVFHGRAAAALEQKSPELAANSWVWSLAAWIALGDERRYLSQLEEAVLGKGAKNGGIPPERIPLELVTDLGHRADAAARDLAPAGTAALLALAKSGDAVKIAGVNEAAGRPLKIEANRHRTAAIETALNQIADAIDEAAVRGELASGRSLILRAVAVWTWSGHDEQVEHFVVGQLDRIGWELYRARNWTALRYLMDPFRPMTESLAGRVEKDPSQLAYAAGCAQMFVFMSETDMNPVSKLALAERAVKICPTHRNGRVVLASILCDRASDLIRQSSLVTRHADLDQAAAMLDRAELLYPQTRELPEIRKKLATARQNRLVW